MGKAVRVEVASSVIQWALVRSGKAEELMDKFPEIQDWISGKKKPTLKQLESFADKTYTPLGCFFLQNPPDEELPIQYFRTFNDQTAGREYSRNLLHTIQLMQKRQNWLREYLIEEGYAPLKFVDSVKDNEIPAKVANKIKKELQLNDDWASKQPSWEHALKILRNHAEDAGIMVVRNSVVGNNTHRKLDPLEFRGFVLVDNYAPLVFINGADAKAAQMFTFAHELAHIWLGVSAAFDLRNLQPADNKVERFCNMVAAEFLVPAKELKQYWYDVPKDRDPFEVLARIFKVSQIVVARRALDLGFINKNEFIVFYNNYIEKISGKEHEGDKGSGDFYKTQNLRIGKLFMEAIVSAVKEEKLLYREAYQLTGLRGKTFNEYVNREIIGGMI